MTYFFLHPEGVAKLATTPTFINYCME